MVDPVGADLAAQVASESVDGAADVSQLLLGRQAVDVPAVPQNPAGQRHQHKQGSCTWVTRVTRKISNYVINYLFGLKQ